HVNPTNLPQLHLQNPSFPIHANSFITQNPGPTPSAAQQALLERAEAAAAKAHEDLLSAGETVSAWKVSQAVLASLKADSWSSLGFQLQDVRRIRELFAKEGKFIENREGGMAGGFFTTYVVNP
ncbi:hypothetical protein ACMD2_16556, partial [Ananas comosus]